MATKVDTNLVWLDLEMTDLDPKKGKIIEVACLITDMNLNVIAQSENIIIGITSEDMQELDPWVKKKHHESGLFHDSLLSTITLREAEDQILGLIRQHCAPQSAPLCGNSVHVDRLFLHYHMPRIYGYLHHHIIDIDSLQEIMLRWGPGYPAFDKIRAHRAMGDVYESIRELKYLLDQLNKSK
jgi:oligoribonuclease